MESRNNNRDFEQFLKQNADLYRMFPSENVWRGIDKALHTRRRWYGLGLAFLLLLTGGGVTWVMMTTPSAKDRTVTQSKTATTTTPGISMEPQVPVGPSTTTRTPVITGPQIFSYPNATVPGQDANNLDVAITSEPVQSVRISGANLEVHPQLIARQSTTLYFSGDPLPAIPSSPFHINTGLVIPIIPEAANSESLVVNNTAAKETRDIELMRNTEIYPLTIESVINSYKRSRPARAFALQYYIAPTISYRKLTENKTFLRSAASSGTVPASVAYRDVNNAVTHKPDIGLEVGVAAKYPLTRLLHLRAGLQFNVSRYDIRAFNNPGEIATIALDAGAGTNSISRETIYRNYNGSRTNWLQNLYYSASIPVGAELRFPSTKSTYFAIAATVQPTYIISDRAYLLSTDYKNYVEVPSLIRRWNVNTGFEALVGYSSGDLQWQIGPQVRYQMRSSFQDQYPLKENLFDFGLKVGVMFNR